MNVVSSIFYKCCLAYSLGRNEYTDESLNLMLKMIDLPKKTEAKQDGITDILDIGAGTGKLCRALALKVDSHVTFQAIEPVAGMRRVFQTRIRENGHIPIKDGTAESLPLRSESVRNVVVGQAFHWFSTVKSLREVGLKFERSTQQNNMQLDRPRLDATGDINIDLEYTESF